MLDHPGRPPTVDVWVVAPVEANLGPWLLHLDAAERARARSLSAHQAPRFVQARALLRGVVGDHLHCTPRTVPLRVECPDCGGAHGPVLVDTGTRTGTGTGTDRAAGPFVSITRAGSLMAVAVPDAGPVGVDIESHAAVSAAPLTRIGLPGRELAAHERRGRRGARALARSWVSAEAVLKAAGTGLRTDPAHLEIRSRRGRRTARTPDGSRALLADLALGPHLAGAVALVLPGRRPRFTVRLHDGGEVLARLQEDRG